LGAFLSTGRPMFDAKIVNAMMESARKLPAPQSPRAHVFLWENPIPGEQYLIPCDVAEGKDAGVTDVTDPERGGADFCCGWIIRVRDLRAVGLIHGRITPIEFGRLLMGAGRLFNWAVIAVERNNHGHSTINTLETSQYPQVYRHLEYDQGGTISFLRAGFPTDAKTRPMIVDALDTAIRSQALICQDPGFWRECSTFQRGPTGKPEALPNCHDDRVISMAIGAYLCTMGRNAWGCPPMAGSDAAGFPIGPVGAAPAAVTPPPAVDPTTPIQPSGIWDEITSQRAALRANRCESCTSYPLASPAEGKCASNNFTCRGADPACAMYYPREIAEGVTEIPPISGEVVW
jgi:hypothetical protein